MHRIDRIKSFRIISREGAKAAKKSEKPLGRSGKISPDSDL